MKATGININPHSKPFKVTPVWFGGSLQAAEQRHQKVSFSYALGQETLW